MTGNAEYPGGQIRVTAIVPVYNAARHIDACITSLLEQNTDGLEVIVVDDGSTDGAPELIQDRARLLRTGGRRGAGYARNVGAKAAHGSYLFFTDADVVVPPDWIGKHLRVIADKSVRAGGGGYAGTVAKGFVPAYAHEELAWRRRKINGYVHTLVANNMFCERELFLKTGGFPETYVDASSEDMEFSWKLALAGVPMWWDRDNGVIHAYPATLSAYLKQQFRFARDAVAMLWRSKGLLQGRRTHHPKAFYGQVLLAGLFLAAIIAWPFHQSAGYPVLLLCVWLGAHAWFLVHVGAGQGIGFALRAAGMLAARDIAILAGAMHGLLMAAKRGGRKP